MYTPLIRLQQVIDDEPDEGFIAELKSGLPVDEIAASYWPDDEHSVDEDKSDGVSIVVPLVQYVGGCICQDEVTAHIEGAWLWVDEGILG